MTKSRFSIDGIMPKLLLAIFGLLLLWVASAHAQLRGHGGPVRALALSADGKTAISGSFDTWAIRWSLQSDTAQQVLRFHDGAINAVAMLPDGRIATGGADMRIALWKTGEQKPASVLEGHTAPIVALAVSPDGTMLASASWDRTARIWPLAGSALGAAPRVLEGHQQNVNGVAFAPDGTLVSAGYDLTLRLWPPDGGEPTQITLPSPLNSVAVAPDGGILTGAANGKVYLLSAKGEPRGEIEAEPTPIIGIAVSRDGRLAAAAGIRGSVAIIDRTTGRVTRTLVGPGMPVWSAAFLPDNRTLMTGGADRVIRRWDTTTGDAIGSVAFAAADDPLAAYAGDHGAEIYRACIACHTLTPDEGNRAGPTLAGIFGRRIATLPGYRFSPALKQLDIVWTPETVAKLFEIGPAAYTPGTKMPEQRITAPEDRAALVEFLQKATKAK
jgi:cytochrome c